MKKPTFIYACVIIASISLSAILLGLQGIRQQTILTHNLPAKTMAVQIPPPRVGSNNQDWNITWGGSKLDEGYVTLDPTGQFLYMAGETNGVAGDNTKGDACLVKFSINGSQLWNQTWGNPSWADYAECRPAVDASGNIYVAGRTENSVVAPSAFLLKYAPNGTLLWTYTYGTGSLPSESIDVTMDANGFVYITGLTQLVLNDYQALIVKFYPNGTQMWNTTWGGPGAYPAGDDYAYGISVDDSNNLYICGITNSYGAGGFDGFVSKYNAVTSTLIWNKTWGGTGDDEFLRCGLGPDGYLYVVGETNSFGAGGYDAVLVKYDTNGNQVWNRTSGGNSDDLTRELCFDAQNNIYASGYTKSFGAGGYDIYFSKYDSTGNLLWNRTWGGPLDETEGTIQLDAYNNIYLGGTTYSWGAGNGDGFIAYIHDTPVITAPSTLSYIYGISGNTIAWSINDYITNGPTYSVYHNSTLWGPAGQSWASNVPLATNVDGLVVGNHNFTLIAQDGTGLSALATVVVSVRWLYPLTNGVWQNVALGSQILYCAENMTEYAELLIEGTAEGAQIKITAQSTNPLNSTLAEGIAFFSIELNGLDMVKFPVTAQFFYDLSQLPSGVDASRLQVYHFENSAWVEVAGVLNPDSHSITVNCPSFSVYAIAVRPSGQPNLTFDPLLWGSIGIGGIVIVIIVMVVKNGKGKKPKKQDDNLFNLWD